MILRRLLANIHAYWGQRSTASSSGFTLIEMLVVVAVIVVVTSTVIANNNRFGGAVLLQNLAYDIALSARESQVYGISVLHFDGAFNTAFGMNFDESTKFLYTLFGDANGNNYFDGPGSGESVQTSNITSGYFISNVCVTDSGGVENCAITKLNIIYRRPEPDAYIYANNEPTLYQTGRIEVQSPRGDNLSIWIHANGQISVHN